MLRHSAFAQSKRLRGVLLSALSLTLPCALIVASPTAVEARLATSAIGQNLVVNGDFLQGTTGWRINDATTSLSPRWTEQRGDAVAISDRTGTTAVLNDTEPTIQSTESGTRALVEAWVRAAGSTPLNGQVRVREVKDGRVILSETSFRLTDSAWTKVSLDVDFETNGGSVDLNVLAWNLDTNQELLVDMVSMRMVDGSDPTPLPGGMLSNGCAYTKIGIPACGAYMGAAYGSNTDPSTIESNTYGRNFGVRRTYFGPTQVDSAVRIAGADLAKGRLPWISFRLPYSWADMAAGKGDAWARDLSMKLDRLNGPVWLAFHHEPEGDGSMKEWTAMQRHLSNVVKGNSDNVAFTLIVMGWHQLYGDEKYSLDNIWPGDDKVDVLAADFYQWYGVTSNGRTENRFLDVGKEYFAPFAAFAKAHDVAWGLAETGLSDKAFAEHPDWIKKSYDDMVNLDGVAYTYFDTDLHAVGNSSWSLGTAAERAAFKQAMWSTPSLPKLG